MSVDCNQASQLLPQRIPDMDEKFGRNVQVCSAKIAGAFWRPRAPNEPLRLVQAIHDGIVCEYRILIGENLTLKRMVTLLDAALHEGETVL